MKNLIRRVLKEEVVDITDIQDELLMMPLDARQKLRDDLNDSVDMDSEGEYVDIEEQISYKGIPNGLKDTLLIKQLTF